MNSIRKKVCLIMILLLTTLIVKADNITNTLVGKNQVSPGETLSLDFNVNSTSSIYSYKVTVTYDSNDVKLVSINNKEGVTGSNNINSNTFVFNTNGTSGSISLANFIFKANKNTSSKNTTIKISGLACMGNPSETSTESNFCKNAEIKQVGEFTQNISLKSNNNFLSTIKLDNEEISNFSKTETDYEIAVESNVDKITISAISEDSKASVAGTGKKKLEYGVNNFNISVISESGDTKTYNLKITRKDERKSDNYLKSIIINGKNIKKFETNTLSYKVYLYKITNVDDVKIEAITSDSQATYKIEKPKTIVKGENIYKIIVKSENGEENTYTLKVYNIDKEISKKLELLSLSGYKITFNKNTNRYEVYYNKDKIDNLKIIYKTQEKSEYVDVTMSIDVDKTKNLSRLLKPNQTITITIEGIDGKKEEYEIYFKKDNRINFFAFVIVIIIIILGIVLYKKIKDKNMPVKSNKQKEIKEEPKKEIKEETEEDLFATKELTNEDLKRIRR